MKPVRFLLGIPCRRAIPVRGPGVQLLTALVAAILATLTPSARADDETQAENTAMAFVRENHPELATLLVQLKPMKPDEYRKAVRELAMVSKSLATLKTNNPRRYAAALDTWKARSRVQLAAAHLSNANTLGSTAASELESQLREAVEAQVDAEIRQAKVDKQVVEERARKLAENLARLEAKRDSAVESRVQSLLKQSRRGRRTAAKADGPSRNNDNVKTRKTADESATREKEPRS